MGDRAQDWCEIAFGDSPKIGVEHNYDNTGLDFESHKSADFR